jgi:hypothetical protein
LGLASIGHNLRKMAHKIAKNPSKTTLKYSFINTYLDKRQVIKIICREIKEKSISPYQQPQILLAA